MTDAIRRAQAEGTAPLFSTSTASGAGSDGRRRTRWLEPGGEAGAGR